MRSDLPSPPRLIGIDFDNTLVDYADAFRSVGIAMGLLPADFRGDRVTLRGFIRTSSAGEIGWRKLQARVYGPDIALAKPMAGALAFLERARGAGSDLALVSHKSRFAEQDPNGIDLREAARSWLVQNRIPFASDRVFFEETRAAKLARIAGLGCSHFIDDLPEVLSDPGFPPRVERILFAVEAGPGGHPYPTHRSWESIADSLFGPSPAGG